MKRAAPTRAVVFDFDGTLIDSLSFVLQALGHAIGPYGTPPTMEIFPQLGGPPESFIPKLLNDPRHVPAVVDRMAEFHRTNGHLLQPFPGAVPMLRRLQARGIRLGLWTGRDRTSTDFLLGHHGLGEFFGATVCGDDLPSHKPEPAGLKRILTALGVRPAEALLVGDSDVDVAGGVAGGVDTLLIGHGREVEAGIRAQCLQVMPSPEEAYAEILSLVETA